MTQTPMHTGDRRPIATRDRKWSQRAAAMLARMGVHPNTVSVLGMLSGCAAGAAFALANEPATLFTRTMFLLGAVLVQLRLIANMLDGMVAIASGKTSRTGELYNEVPDRVSDAATLVGLGLAVQSDVQFGLAAACVAIFVAYVRVQGKVAGAPQDFSGPMAKQHRMFIVTLAALFMALAPDAWQRTATITTRELGAPAAALVIIIVGGAFTALRRLRHISRTLRETPADG